jgi:GPI-anchor transamidase subunit GAA1
MICRRYVDIPFREYNCHDSRCSVSAFFLRGDPRLRKVPPYISFLCVIVGVAWLLLLPLNEYSRKTYVSENALLPGQVHTYFAGSDQSVFRGLKHEVNALAGKGNKEYLQPVLVINFTGS